MAKMMIGSDELGFFVQCALFLSQLKGIDPYLAQWAEAKMQSGSTVQEVKDELRSLIQKSGRE